MTEVYVVVGVDQDGDACWDVVSDLAAARKVKVAMDETATTKIYRVDLSLSIGDSFQAELLVK